MASPTFDTNAGSVQYKQGGFATTLALPGLSTDDSPDTIVVVAFYEVYATGPFSVSGVTSTNLTFTKRSSVLNTTSGAHDMSIEVWTAPAASTLSSEVITVNWTGTGTMDGICLAAFALTGLHSTSTPFDTNGALPATAFNTTATTPPVMSITTSQADDLLFYFAGDSAGHIVDGGLAPTGWTSLFSGVELHNASYINYCYGCVAYKSVSSTQSGTSVVTTQTANDVSYVSDVDAFTADAAGTNVTLIAAAATAGDASSTPNVQPTLSGIATTTAVVAFSVNVNGNPVFVSAAVTGQVAAFTPSVAPFLIGTAAIGSAGAFQPTPSVTFSGASASGVVASFGSQISFGLTGAVATAHAAPFLATRILVGAAAVGGVGLFQVVLQPSCDLLVVGAINPAQVAFGLLTDVPVVGLGCLVNSPVIVQAVMCCSC